MMSRASEKNSKLASSLDSWPAQVDSLRFSNKASSYFSSLVITRQLKLASELLMSQLS